MHRILKCGDMEHTTLTPDKLNSLMYESPSCIKIHRSYNILKAVRFLDHHMAVSVALLVASRYHTCCLATVIGESSSRPRLAGSLCQVIVVYASRLNSGDWRGAHELWPSTMQ